MGREDNKVTGKTNPKPTNREKDESYNLPGEEKGYSYEDCTK